MRGVVVAAAAVAIGLVAGLARGAERDRRLMDFGWKFRLADASMPGEGGTAVTGWKWKAVEGKPAGEVPTVDGTWKDVAAGADVFGGRVGFAWYSATLPEGKAGGTGRVLVFDGVDDNAIVYLNGKRMGAHEGWSEAFEVPLDEAWMDGGPNVVTVLVENTAGIGGIKGATLREGASAVAAKGFDDSNWRGVDVPHDFVIERPVEPVGDANYGFHPGGVGWYRRHFTVEPSQKGKRVWLEFDGVYRDAKVYVNGKPVGGHPSGYTSFYFDVTDVVRAGEDNVVAVRVDATSHEGWWYEGGGIYRHVWLETVGPVHVGHWGTFVSAEVTGALPAERAGAVVHLKTDVANESEQGAKVVVRSEVLDAEGKSVGVVDAEAELGGGKTGEVAQEVKLADARLWSVETPYLYHVVTTVRQGEEELDRVVSPLGVRQLRFDADHGFFLNGRPVKIKGTCNHQDFAGLGIALPDRIHEYKIEKLKEMGANAYRCSHHQYAEEILDACDRMGMLVMDENRHLGESEQILDEAATLVRRDRNHPSVILWSICNEEGAQGSAEGRRKAQAIKDVFNKYDGTRPVTAAMNAGWGGEGISNVLDVQGFNYNYEQYDPYHKAHPKQPLIGSETASILTTRGEYKQDDVRGYMSSYSDGAERAWRPVAEREFMAGAFIWTGFDYRGEPTPFGWPCVNSHFGVMDMCGFPKDDYYYYQAAWTDKPVLHLLPHWNWAYPRRGENEDNARVEVRCYTNCDEVELFVNGKSQGKKPGVRTGHVAWRVKWNPGEISAKGWKGGKEVATAKVETAGVPATIRLTADRSEVRGDGEDVVLVSAEVVDSADRVVPGAEDEVEFGVEGGNGAAVIGVGNGDPSSHEADKATSRRAFHGRCMAIVKVGTGAGALRVTARAAGLPEAVTQIGVQAATPRPRVAIVR